MGHVTDRHVTIKELQKMGYPVIPGNEYIPKEWLPKKPVSLETVRRRLAKIRGSLAQTVADMRDEES
ncbi:MAG: hypothetical protein Q8R91_06945 [Candidatus Omnitrophota bacterium]|nr:hypothetical protein [Candidatus Omnitrophota bacterium]